MEIRTTKSLKEPTDSEATPPPDRSRYLRRKTTQKLRKSHPATRRVIAALKTAGKLVIFALIAAFVVREVIYTYTSDRFSVQTITVYGCKHQDPQKLEEVIHREFPQNLLRIDLGMLRGRLEREAWIKHAEIRRVLPSKIVVYVEERIPTVVLEIQGELMLADDEGILLDKYDTKYGKMDVPVFKGILGDSPSAYVLNQKENSERIQLALKMMQELGSGSSTFSSDVSEVDLSDKSNVRILLVGETAEIYLGNRDFLKRFRTLMANLTQYRDLKSQYTDIASVDLRFDGQIIYRPRRAASAASGAAPEARP